MKLGTAMAARIAMIATTINSSMRVKPRCLDEAMGTLSGLRGLDWGAKSCGERAMPRHQGKELSGFFMAADDVATGYRPVAGVVGLQHGLDETDGHIVARLVRAKGGDDPFALHGSHAGLPFLGVAHAPAIVVRVEVIAGAAPRVGGFRVGRGVWIVAIAGQIA